MKIAAGIQTLEKEAISPAALVGLGALAHVAPAAPAVIGGITAGPGKRIKGGIGGMLGGAIGAIPAAILAPTLAAKLGPGWIKYAPHILGLTGVGALGGAYLGGRYVRGAGKPRPQMRRR